MRPHRTPEIFAALEALDRALDKASFFQPSQVVPEEDAERYDALVARVLDRLQLPVSFARSSSPHMANMEDIRLKMRPAQCPLLLRFPWIQRENAKRASKLPLLRSRLAKRANKSRLNQYK